MYNKFVFDSRTGLGFKFPMTLVLCHMAFCSLASAVLIRLGVSPTVDMTWADYRRCIVPIALFFSVSLACSQSAYVHLSVSFVQMIKTALPAVTFFVSVAAGILRFDLPLLGTIVVISLGVAVASYGELEFVLIGVVYQLTALVADAVRLVLTEKLLKARGVTFNPLQVLYYVAPCSLPFLVVAWAYWEFPALVAEDREPCRITGWHVLANCINAFAVRARQAPRGRGQGAHGMLRCCLVCASPAQSCQLCAHWLDVGPHHERCWRGERLCYDLSQLLGLRIARDDDQHRGLCHFRPRREPLQPPEEDTAPTTTRAGHGCRKGGGHGHGRRRGGREPAPWPRRGARQGSKAVVHPLKRSGSIRWGCSLQLRSRARSPIGRLTDGWQSPRRRPPIGCCGFLFGSRLDGQRELSY